MAAAISVHNMLQRMGLSLEAATEVVNVNGQNLSVLEDFLQLEDKDVEILCRVIRRPGGVNAARNQNQGMQVSAMAEANLKRMCYQLHHHTRVSRPVVWFVPYRHRLRWRRLIGTPSHCLSWIQRIGPRILKPLTSTSEDSEATRNPHCDMSIARILFRPWLQLTP